MVAVRCASRLKLPPASVSLVPSVAGGSADPITNAALAAALKAAKSSGVPRINIENALKKVREPIYAPSWRVAG